MDSGPDRFTELVFVFPVGKELPSAFKDDDGLCSFVIEVVFGACRSPSLFKFHSPSSPLPRKISAVLSNTCLCAPRKAACSPRR